MRKHFTFLIIILTITSCKPEFEKEIEITEQFKFEFLNEILSDTIDIKILKSKDQLISNVPILIKPAYVSLIDSIIYDWENFNHVKFISNTLNINDTIFVKNQFKENENLDLSYLSEYGFRIFDLNSHYQKFREKGLNIDDNLNSEQIDMLVKGVELIDKMVDSLNVGMESYLYLSISKPIFNKEMNLAYIRISTQVWGYTLILKLENEKWIVKDKIGEWIS